MVKSYGYKGTGEKDAQTLGIQSDHSGENGSMYFLGLTRARVIDQKENGEMN